MRLAVCFKQVPDTSARLRVEPGALEPHRGGLLPVVNPYDEFALEAAMGLEDRGHDLEIVLFTLAAEEVEESVFHGLAIGADRAVVLRPTAGAAPGPAGTARILATAIAPWRPDLVFCGERAVDDDAAQVGPLLAETLGLPQICGAERVELDTEARRLTAVCRRPGWSERLDCELPCLVTFVRGEKLPRYPSLDDVLGAGEKPVEIREVDPGEPAALRRVALAAPRETRAGRVIAAEPRDAVQELLGDPDGLASFL